MNNPMFNTTPQPMTPPGVREWIPSHPPQPCCEPIPHIRADHLTIRYHHRPALNDVTLDIHQGCLTTLVGPSGCGKTSFLMSINRLTDLIPGCRVTGQLHIKEQDVLAPSTNTLTLRKSVGMIFQKPIMFPFSIKKNLDLPLQEHGIRDKSTRAATIQRRLQQVGLWEEVKDRLNTPAQALSGGQQQRLCLARALLLEPSILLLDEPCSALDPLSSGVVEDLILSLRGQFTIVVVTHNLAQARRIADHVAFFWTFEDGGQLVEHAPAKNFFESPQAELTAAYVSGARG